MSFLKIIEDFTDQFKWNPKIENEKNFFQKKRFVIAGMGGSNLAGGFAKMFKNDLSIIFHRSYDLPDLDEKNIGDFLIICSSYSGNTEEVLSSYASAKKKNLSIFVMAEGGKLLEEAKRDKIPYIKLPHKKIPPRMALGYSLIATLKILGEEEIISNLRNKASNFDYKELNKRGKILAKDIAEKIPVIYSSLKNEPLAYNWKIRINETGKIPAFYNVFPELNHNEIEGFIDSADKYQKSKFIFLFIKDEKDKEVVKKRMEILSVLYRKSGYEVKEINLKNGDSFQNVLFSLSFSDWTSYYLAKHAGIDPESVPAIENFKKII